MLLSLFVFVSDACQKVTCATGLTSLIANTWGNLACFSCRMGRGMCLLLGSAGKDVGGRGMAVCSVLGGCKYGICVSGGILRCVFFCCKAKSLTFRKYFCFLSPSVFSFFMLKHGSSGQAAFGSLKCPCNTRKEW